MILGLGRFGGGLGAARFLARRGFMLRVSDRADAATLAEAREQLDALETDVDWRLGADATPADLEGIDVLVVNPAVRPGHPLLAAATERGTHTTQEINLFLEHHPGTTVLITGTNGKSTTATLLAAALEGNGRDVLLGGNIGTSLLEQEASWHEDQIAVLEISSAQLTRVDPARHRVRGAVLTPVTQDHIDWHGSLEAYHRAKLRALACADDFVVFHADNEVAANGATGSYRRLRYHAAVPLDGEVGVDDGWVTSRLPRDPGRVLHADAARLFGRFHLTNMAAAFCAAHELGADRGRSGLAMSQVAPLPHRLQLVAQREGRRVFGNAVSTEVQSTVSALKSIPGRIHWVGGGKSKDGDFAGTARSIASSIASAHVFGAAAEPLGAELAHVVPTTCHEHLEQALDAAWRRSSPGDALLFSPAFASFDQFANFRARAAAFDRWVATEFGRGPGIAEENPRERRLDAPRSRLANYAGP